MERIHDVHRAMLREMLDLRDKRDRLLSPKVIQRVEIAQDRLNRRHGRFREMLDETLLAMIADIPEEELSVERIEPDKPVEGARLADNDTKVLPAPKPTVDYTKWAKDKMLGEIAKRKLPTPPAEANRDDLIAILVNADNAANG